MGAHKKADKQVAAIAKMVGERVRLIRENWKMSRDVFCREWKHVLGWGEQRQQQIELGNAGHELSIDTILRLSEALDLEPHELIMPDDAWDDHHPELTPVTKEHANFLRWLKPDGSRNAPQPRV